MSQTMNKFSSKWRSDHAIPHTERDADLLLALFAKKYMSTSQIRKLFWGDPGRSQQGAIKACQRRLRQLEAYSAIRRIEQAVRRAEGRKDDLFTLGVNSIAVLVNERGVNPKLIDLRPWLNEENNPQVKHILELTNVQIAWKEACVACDIGLDAWVDEKAIRIQYANESGTFFDKYGNPVKKPIADAFTILTRSEKRGYFWIEVDRSNINVNLSVYDRPTIAGKVQRFLAWEQNQTFREEFGPRPLRKLFITRGMGRLHNIRLVTEQMITQFVEENDDLADEQRPAEIQRLTKRFFFTTFDLFYTHNPLLHSIWYQVGTDAPGVLLG